MKRQGVHLLSPFTLENGRWTADLCRVTVFATPTKKWAEAHFNSRTIPSPSTGRQGGPNPLSTASIGRNILATSGSSYRQFGAGPGVVLAAILAERYRLRSFVRERTFWVFQPRQI
jgi:hypothetical protein